MEKIRVFIVDDHELFRFSLRTVIECRYPDIIIAGEAGSGAAFFSLLKTVTADIVLLDISMPVTYSDRRVSEINQLCYIKPEE